MRLTPLAREHRPLLSQFQCRSPELVVYLRRFALRHQQRDRLSHTHLALTGTPPEERLAGWFSLAAASVDRTQLTGLPGVDALPRFPVPAILLARLAVDDRVAGQGVGRWLFDQALRIALATSERGPFAARLLIADPKDDAAAAFYERLGMTRLGDGTRMAADLAAPLTGSPARTTSRARGSRSAG